jgi:hypothetical protein
MQRDQRWWEEEEQRATGQKNADHTGATPDRSGEGGHVGGLQKGGIADLRYRLEDEGFGLNKSFMDNDKQYSKVVAGMVDDIHNKTGMNTYKEEHMVPDITTLINKINRSNQADALLERRQQKLGLQMGGMPSGGIPSPPKVNSKQFQVVLEALKRYNAGKLNLSDEQAEQLAQMAFQMKREFKTKSKPIRKGLFDLVDTAALGLVPNKWRPRSPGQELHGESDADWWAGGIGSVAGMPFALGGLYGAVKSAPKIANKAGQMYRGGRDMGADFLSRGAEYGSSLNIGNRLIGNRLRALRDRGANFTSDAMEYGSQYKIGDRIKDTVSSIKERENIKRAVSHARNFYNDSVSRGSDFLSRGAEWWMKP